MEKIIIALKILIYNLKELLSQLVSKQSIPNISNDSNTFSNSNTPDVPDYIPQEIPDKPVCDFSTPEKARLSTIRICAEKGLNQTQTETICGVIACESGFNINAKNENKDKNGKVLSTDFGICQYNDYYYIGENKPIPSIDVALHDPEFCVKIMIDIYLGKISGRRIKDWVCFSSGKYTYYK